MMQWLLKLGISVAVLAALIWWADAQAVADKLRGADLMWLSIALATLTLLTFLMARRWQIVARTLGIKLTFPRALAEYYVAQLGNTALPGGVLGDVGRAFRIRHEADLVRAAQSVAAERLFGQIFVFALMAVGFSGALLVPGGTPWPDLAWFGVLVAILAAAGALILARGGTPTARFLRLILALCKDPQLVAYGIVITALLIFSLYACARATGTLIPTADLLTLLPLILSAMLIPLSVGGWGWREGAAAALFPLIGASASAGVATGIAYGAMVTLATLPALFVLMKPSKLEPPSSNLKMDVL